MSHGTELLSVLGAFCVFSLVGLKRILVKNISQRVL